MSEWKLIKASDFIDFNPRETLKKGTVAKKIGMEYLKPHERDITGFEEASFSGGTKFRNNDTLMARITPCLENGKTAKVNILEENEIGFGSTEFIVMRAKQGISDPDFIYYLSKSPFLRDKAIASMIGTSGRQRVQQPVLSDTEFLAPDLETQTRIAATLRSLDDKIANNKKINKTLEDMAQAVFRSWFVDFETGEAVIGQHLTPKRGKNITAKQVVLGDIPIIAGGLEPSLFHNNSNTDAPVITISASGANAGFINLWHVPVWSSDSSYIDRKVNPYIYFWYVMLKLRQIEIFEMQTGSAQPHVYPSHIVNMPIPILNLEEIKKYNEFVQPIFKQIKNNQIENQNLATLRNELLPKLISGEIEV